MSVLDFYLTGNPQITYFKNVFKRHTNFKKDEEIIYNDKIIDSILTLKIEKNSDLMNGIYLIVDLHENVQHDIENIDKYIIEYAEIYFDGTCIQQITKDYLFIANNLLYKKNKTKKIGNKIIINLPFWFEEIPNALPLISLKNTEIKLKIKFNIKDYIKNIKIITNRIFVEHEERMILAKEKNSYIFANNYTREFDINCYGDHIIQLDNMKYVIDLFVAFTKQNGEKFFDYKDISPIMEITTNNKMHSHEKIYYTHYMQNNYMNPCENVYVYSFSLNPTSSSYNLYGFINSNLTLLNKFDNMMHEKYKMKLIIRHYSLLTVENGTFTIDNIHDKNYNTDLNNVVIYI